MRIEWAASALTLLAFAGCMGDVETPERQTPETDAQGRYIIHLTALDRFAPEDSQVPSGATVVFVNDVASAGGHDVNGYLDGDQETFASLRAPPEGYGKLFHEAGEQWAYTFTEDGIYSIDCHPHHSVGMLGTIKVG